MKLLVLNAAATIYEGVVSEVTLPASGGEMTLMDNHETALIALKEGFVRLRPVGDFQASEQSPEGAVKFRRHSKRRVVKQISIRQGIARMGRNELVILVE